MSVSDILILGALVCGIVLAVSILSKKKGCGCGCGSCPMADSCKEEKNKE